VFALFTVNVVFLPARARCCGVVGSDQLLAANSLLAGAGILATAIARLRRIHHRPLGMAFAMPARCGELSDIP